MEDNLYNKYSQIKQKHSKVSMRQQIKNKRARNEIQIDESQIKFPTTHLQTYKDYSLKMKVLQFLMEENIDPNKNYLSLLFSENIDESHEGIIGVRKLIIKKQISLQKLIDLGCIQKILELASQDNYLHLSLEALWCLANIASGTNGEVTLLMNKGILKIYEDKLQTQYVQIIEQCLWGIGNISGESVSYSKQILNSQIPQFLYQLYGMLGKNYQITINWIFSNILRYESTSNNQNPIQIGGMLNFMITNYVTINDADSQMEILQGIKCFMQQKYMNYFLNENFIQKIIIDFSQILMSSYSQEVGHKTKIQTILHVLGQLSSSSDGVFAIIAIRLGLLSQLKESLFTLNFSFLENILWIISNLILEQNKDIPQKIMHESGLVEKILELTLIEDENIKKEAIFCIAGLCSSKQEGIVLMLLEKNILQSMLVNISKFKDSQTTIINLILDSLISILQLLKDKNLKQYQRVIEELIKIKIANEIIQLQYHPFETVYLRALIILENFFLQLITQVSRA